MARSQTTHQTYGQTDPRAYRQAYPHPRGDRWLQTIADGAIRVLFRVSRVRS